MTRKGTARFVGAIALLTALILVVAACGQSAPPPADEPAAVAAEATEPAAAEPTAVPAEEEPTAVPAEEEPTAMPAEEEGTPAPEEEPAEAAMTMGDLDAGAYVFTMAGGCGCHFNRDLGALAGGSGFMDDAVYSRNLTPHATGIANLSDEALADLIRIGSHDGYTLAVMPNYSTMADQDVMNLIAYLRAQPAVENEIPDRNLSFEPQAREYPAPPAEAPTEGAARGTYVASIVRCGRCHTPTNDDGSPMEGMLLAGAPYRDTVASNLTPDEATGLGSWSEEEIVDFLTTGVYADGTESHSGMKGVVDNILSKLTDGDRQAISQALMSLPAVSNEPTASQ